MTDAEFFNTNPERQARIRVPGRQLAKNRQRAVAYIGEFEPEFATLAPHDRRQRRVLVWRVPPENPAYDPDHPQLLPIPYVLMPGEIIEDTDDVLLPLIHQIMSEA